MNRQPSTGVSAAFAGGVALATFLAVGCGNQSSGSGAGGGPGAGGAGGSSVSVANTTGVTGATAGTGVSSTTGSISAVATGSSSSSASGMGAPFFSPYKDTSINMDWNTNVLSTKVSGSMTSLTSDLSQSGGHAVTLAFATGNCGSESWGGVPGAMLAQANVSMLNSAGISYVVSTGGASGTFTCDSDAGMETFIGRWASSGLVGVDFDIEAGQSQAVIDALVQRIEVAHQNHPALRFSVTLATLANNAGANTAKSLGTSAQDSFNTYGDMTMMSIESKLGFNGSEATWPSYVVVNLMTMDYGSPSPGVCVVDGGACQMGQSALQAAYNLHDKWGVPYSHIELTPMIGGNDVSSEQFTLSDATTVAQFALTQGLAGVHYWSYDRDVDCPPGSASPTCNSLGTAGPHGFLTKLLGAGLH